MGRIPFCKIPAAFSSSTSCLFISRPSLSILILSSSSARSCCPRFLMRRERERERGGGEGKRERKRDRDRQGEREKENATRREGKELKERGVESER